MPGNAALDDVRFRERWDVVVLGAGPAGAVAARQIAIEGRSVLLVEQHRLPRAKVCGGCLGAAALRVLEELGLGDLPAACRAVPLRAMELSSAGARATLPLDRRVAVDRSTFDAALVRAAAAAGATVCDETRGAVLSTAARDVRAVRLQRGGRHYTTTARVVLAATGLRGAAGIEYRVARRSRLGASAIIPVDDAEPAPPSDVLRMACSEAGYAGLAPLAGGRVDVAAALDPAALRAAGSPAAAVAAVLQAAGLVLPVRLAAAPWGGTPALTRRPARLGGERLLLIGDAAGYVEPFTGEGVGWAMHSAVLAAGLVHQRLDRWTDDVVDQWQALHAQALRAHHRQCYVLTRLLRFGPLRGVAVRSLQRVPALARPVLRRLERPLASEAR